MNYSMKPVNYEPLNLPLGDACANHIHLLKKRVKLTDLSHKQIIHVKVKH